MVVFNVNLASLIVINDIDGIFRFAKGPIDPLLYPLIQTIRTKGACVGVMTGAPVGHLPDMELDYYWAESGAVQRDFHGHDLIEREAHDFARCIHNNLRFFWHNGYLKTPDGYIILEGESRYASVCILTGNPPHYENPQGFVTETMDNVEYWIRRSCSVILGEKNFAIARGKDTTYEFLDITHPDFTKRIRMESFLQTLPKDIQVFYLGDSDSSDLPVMELQQVIGVGFKNSGPCIQQYVKKEGIYIAQDGPTGGTLTFYRRLLEGFIWSDR